MVEQEVFTLCVESSILSRFSKIRGVSSTVERPLTVSVRTGLDQQSTSGWIRGWVDDSAKWLSLARGVPMGSSPARRTK